MIKIEKGKVDLTVVKNAIKESIHTILQNKEYKNTYVVIDVDP
jgi:hypothetical protein